MQLCPYVFFNGQAREAATAYARIFGSPAPELMTMGGAPPDMNIPPERRDWIMHGSVRIGEGMLLLSDDFEGNSPAMAGSSVMASLPTAASAKAVFDQLAEGGEVRMPWEATFWSAGFGALTDRWGIRWMIDTEEAPSQS